MNPFDVAHDEMPPAHREWITAHLTDFTGVQSHRTPVDDWVWVEINPMPDHRRGGSGKCIECQRRHANGITKTKYGHSTANSRIHIKYVRVPPSLQGDSRTTAYWFGTCVQCEHVFWAADENAGSEQ